MYTAHTSTLSFKDNHLRSQVPSRASILACTFDHFRSSWRSGPNHTPRMPTGLSLQRKGPGRVVLPFQEPNRKPLQTFKGDLGPCYLFVPRKPLLHRCYIQKTVILSAYADTFAKRGIAKRMLRRAGLALSSLSLWSRIQRRGDKEQPCWTDLSIADAPERFPFTYTTAFNVVVHHVNPFAELQFESGGLKNSRQEPMINSVEGLGLI